MKNSLYLLIFLPIFIFKVQAAQSSHSFESFFQNYCYDCHDEDSKKGELDLTAVGPNMTSPGKMYLWIRIYDRVLNGEMPPPKKNNPPSTSKKNSTSSWESN